MRSSFIATLGIAGILLASACSSSTEEKGAQQTNAAPQANGATTETAQANSQAMANQGFQVAAPQQADANAVDNAAAGTVDAPMAANRLDALRKSGTEKVNAEELATKNARPAPDNSTFTSYLTDVGYEIRTFKNDRYVSKVVKKTDAAGKQTLQIFLRSGKVVDLPPEKIGSVATIPLRLILEFAGVTPEQSQPAAGAQTKKTAGN